MASWAKVSAVAELAAALPEQGATARRTSATPRGAGSSAPARPAAEAASPKVGPAPSPVVDAEAPASAAAPVDYQQPAGFSQTVAMTPAALAALRETKPWVRLVGITGMVMAGVFVLLGLGVVCLAFISSTGRPNAPSGMPVALLAMTVYLIVAAVYYFPSMFLNRYASQIGETLATRREDKLEAAMQAQRSFWRFVGVIVLLVFLVQVTGLLMLLAFGASLSL